MTTELLDELRNRMSELPEDTHKPFYTAMMLALNCYMYTGSVGVLLVSQDDIMHIVAIDVTQVQALDMTASAAKLIAADLSAVDCEPRH